MQRGTISLAGTASHSLRALPGRYARRLVAGRGMQQPPPLLPPGAPMAALGPPPSAWRSALRANKGNLLGVAFLCVGGLCVSACPRAAASDIRRRLR